MLTAGLITHVSRSPTTGGRSGPCVASVRASRRSSTRGSPRLADGGKRGAEIRRTGLVSTSWRRPWRHTTRCYGSAMEEAGRWARLDEHLPRDLRADLEDRFWRPIEAQASLEALSRRPLVLRRSGPPSGDLRRPWRRPRPRRGRRPRPARGQGRRVAPGPRPPTAGRFMPTYGVAAGISPRHRDGGHVAGSAGGSTRLRGACRLLAGRRPPRWTTSSAPGPVSRPVGRGRRTDPFVVPLGTVVREMLSLPPPTARPQSPRRSWTTEPPSADMQRLVFTSLDDQRAASAPAASACPSPVVRREADRWDYPVPSDAYRVAGRADGPQADSRGRRRGRASRPCGRLTCSASAGRRSGRRLATRSASMPQTAHAVCTLRSAARRRRLRDHVRRRPWCGGGEHRGRVRDPPGPPAHRIPSRRVRHGEVARRAAMSVAGAILDIQADVIPSFGGRTRAGAAAAFAANRATSASSWSDRTTTRRLPMRSRTVLAELDPSLGGRLERWRTSREPRPLERARFYAAEPVEAGDPLAEEIVEQLSAARRGHRGPRPRGRPLRRCAERRSGPVSCL